MASYDISREAFDPAKHYTSVRMQQGRVLTDDDFNENERINDEDTRRELIDIIGPYGSPDDGFRIKLENLNTVFNGQPVLDFTISQGTIYLGGLRLWLEHDETYLLQDDYLELSYADNVAPAGGDRYDLVYLEAWRQPVSAVEDSELFETALGGPDTSTRIRNMARVRVFKNIGSDNCTDAWNNLVTSWRTSLPGLTLSNMGWVPDIKLTVSYTPTGANTDLCSPNVAGGYLGAENQAIRVQLLDKGFFTWGFDDAAPLYRVTVAANGTVTMLTPPKDQYHWPLAGQTVEILPWSAVLPDYEKIAARDGYISSVSASYDPDKQQFGISPAAVPAGFSNYTARNQPELITNPLLPNNPPQTAYYYMRLWNRGTDITSAAKIPYSFGTPVVLGNTGLQVQIDGTDHVPGDHWVIAARPDSPNLVVPWNYQKDGEAPVGYHRFFAPLGIIYWANNNGQTQQPKIIHDCRKTFQPLTSDDCCCTYTVGDGILSNGDFDSIEDALAALPADGGKLCILRGIHRTNAIIAGSTQITIEGCGEQSIIITGPKGGSNPLFTIASSTYITIENLTMFALEGLAVQIGRLASQTKDGVCREISILHNRIIALSCGICVNPFSNALAFNHIHLANNQIFILDKPGSGLAIFSMADDVIIERNRLMVIPAPATGGNGGNGGNGGPWNPCLDKKKLYGNKTLLISTVRELVNFAAVSSSPGLQYAQGGIQIGSTSERVWIYQNEINGGLGNGITLGHLFTDPNQTIESLTGFSMMKDYSTVSLAYVNNNFNSTLYAIEIEENLISSMGLSGIGVAGIFDLDAVGLIYKVEGLGIFRNRIWNCALQTETIFRQFSNLNMNATLCFGGITLSACGHTIIRENQITNNGSDYEWPVCGIFVRTAEEIEISNNRILNNGGAADSKLLKGPRGGIVIDEAIQLPDTKNANKSPAPGFDGIPAAIIRENTVDQPIGHALFLIALGPASVLGNQFTSRSRDTTNPYSLLAGAVYILDLGISKDLLAAVIMKNGSWKNIANTGLNTTSAGTSANTAFQRLLAEYEYFPDGKILFADNQVALDTRTQQQAVFFSAQILAGLDDISYQNNQCSCIGLETSNQALTDLTLIDTVLLGLTIRSTGNRWQEGLTPTLFSLFSVAYFNTTALNHSTHCLLLYGPPATNIDQFNVVLFNPTTCDALRKRIGTALSMHQ